MESIQFCVQVADDHPDACQHPEHLTHPDNVTVPVLAVPENVRDLSRAHRPPQRAGVEHR